MYINGKGLLISRSISPMNPSRRFYAIAGAIVLLAIVVTVYMTKEFLTTILLSIFLVYLLNPLYALFLKFTGKKSLSSFLSIIVVFIAFVYLLFSVIGVLSVEISHLLSSNDLSQLHIAQISDALEGSNEAAFNKISSIANQYLPPSMASGLLGYLKLRLPTDNMLEGIRTFLAAAIYRALPVISAAISSLIAELPIRFAQFLVAIFFTYYLLVDGKSFVNSALDLAPEKEIIKRFLFELNAVYSTLFTVYFTTSLLSGSLAAVGFFLMGISYPVLWGGIIAVFTAIPLVGPVAVYVPMAIYYALIQDYARAAILLVFGTIVLMILPENVIRPKLAMRSAQIHPIITVLAYTAPIFVIGIVGVLLGPALYGFLLAAYRTLLYIRSSEPELQGAELSSTAEALPQPDLGRT
jgi:predicted PurR-regulated permease PerM